MGSKVKRQTFWKVPEGKGVNGMAQCGIWPPSVIVRQHVLSGHVKLDYYNLTMQRLLEDRGH